MKDFFDKIPKWLIEAVKEFFRVMLLAVIPVVIQMLQDGQICWKTVGIIALIAGLKFIDKMLHELGKDKDSKKLVKGLTRF